MLATSSGGGFYFFSTIRRLTIDGSGFVSPVISAGTWYYITMVYRGSGIKPDVYINGSYYATSAATLAANWFTATNWQFAARADGYEYDGILDEISLFNTAKSDAEILELYNSGDGLQYPFSPAGGLLMNPGMDGLGGRYFDNRMSGGMVV